ncbi:MAG TPA: metallophosphoesterase [Clostridia bacterium]|nr:metallophosphoesterase [Clostridia bacterium]
MIKRLSLIKKISIITLAALAGAVIFINIFCNMDTQFKGFQFSIQAKALKSGCTRIVIPPVGFIEADTHRLPLEITVTLNNIDLETVKELVESPPEKEQLESEILPNIHKAAKHIALKMIILAAMGGLFGAFLVKRGISKGLLFGAAGTALLFAILTLAVAQTYNVQKFYAPQFKGILESAPWMVSSAEKRIADLHAFRNQITTISNNVNELSKKLDNIQPISEAPEGLRILHVSDIHNNPAAFDFILKITDAFDVDLVVDTGDISDLGTPLEALLLDMLNQLEIPYLFVPGNHETPDITLALKQYKQVRVIENKGSYEHKGLSITGIADPVSTGYEVNLSVEFDWAAYLESIGFQDNTVGEDPPDLIAVHNPESIEYMKRKSPVILTGHTHKTAITEQAESVVISAGTTGGAGLRGLQHNEDIPYTAVLLHFSDTGENNYRLVAADTLQIGNISGQLSLQRNIF